MTFAKGWSAIQPKHDAKGGRWQQASAAVYAFAGGYADATGYLLVHTFTGHVTGNLILLAIALQHPHWHEIGPRIIAIVAFLCATGAGFRIARLHAAKAGHPRSAWVLLLAQSVLLVAVCLPMVRQSRHYGVLLVAGLCLALGLQNGVVTSSGGVSLHATFLSGDLTTLVKLFSQDRGGNSGNPTTKYAGTPIRLKAVLLLSVVVSFVVGAYCASVWIGKLGALIPLTLIFPLAIAAVLSSVSVAADPAK